MNVAPRSLVIAMLACAALPTDVGCRAKGDEPEHHAPWHVRCAPAAQKPLQDTRMLRGSVVTAPDRDAVVSSQVAGRLVRVPVREGDTLLPDAVIAEVEPRSFSDALKQAEAQLAQAQSLRDAAAATAARETHLVETGLSSAQTLENARASLAQANASVNMAASQVDAARQSVERTLVKAPMGGVVVRLVRRVGEVVDGTPATPIAEIADLSSLELQASAAAADILLFHPGQRATVTFAALPGKRLDAMVRTVSPAIDAASGVGSVHLAIGSNETKPPMGLLGEAEVVLGERSGVAVPAAAIRSGGGASSEVVVCDADKARVRVVETGLRQGGFVEITSGLDAGTKVVVEHVVGIEEGSDLEQDP